MIWLPGLCLIMGYIVYPIFGVFIPLWHVASLCFFSSACIDLSILWISIYVGPQSAMDFSSKMIFFFFFLFLARKYVVGEVVKEVVIHCTQGDAFLFFEYFCLFWICAREILDLSSSHVSPSARGSKCLVNQFFFRFFFFFQTEPIFRTSCFLFIKLV